MVSFGVKYGSLSCCDVALVMSTSPITNCSPGIEGRATKSSGNTGEGWSSPAVSSLQATCAHQCWNDRHRMSDTEFWDRARAGDPSRQLVLREKWLIGNQT